MISISLNECPANLAGYQEGQRRIWPLNTTAGSDLRGDLVIRLVLWWGSEAVWLLHSGALPLPAMFLLSMPKVNMQYPKP